jgi:hypothetical protein
MRLDCRLSPSVGEPGDGIPEIETVIQRYLDSSWRSVPVELLKLPYRRNGREALKCLIKVTSFP